MRKTYIFSRPTEIAENAQSFAKSSASETSKIMQKFAKRLTETDRNVSQNLGANPKLNHAIYNFIKKK